MYCLMSNHCSCDSLMILCNTYVHGTQFQMVLFSMLIDVLLVVSHVIKNNASFLKAYKFSKTVSPINHTCLDQSVKIVLALNTILLQSLVKCRIARWTLYVFRIDQMSFCLSNRMSNQLYMQIVENTKLIKSTVLFYSYYTIKFDDYISN